MTGIPLHLIATFSGGVSEPFLLPRAAVKRQHLNAAITASCAPWPLVFRHRCETLTWQIFVAPGSLVLCSWSWFVGSASAGTSLSLVRSGQLITLIERLLSLLSSDWTNMYVAAHSYKV